MHAADMPISTRLYYLKIHIWIGDLDCEFCLANLTLRSALFLVEVQNHACFHSISSVATQTEKRVACQKISSFPQYLYVFADL